MSKKYEIEEKCPACSLPFKLTMYRSIWGEHPENREIVMSDAVNVAKCRACRLEIKIAASLFYTNAPNTFAVWWEPNPDPQIDADREGYIKLGGANCYLATAPRVKEWNEFKDTILKFERGELKGGPLTFSGDLQGAFKAMADSSRSKKKGGCLGLMLFLSSLILIPWYVGSLITG